MRGLTGSQPSCALDVLVMASILVIICEALPEAYHHVRSTQYFSRPYWL
jgi:hypothetical protein